MYNTFDSYVRIHVINNHMSVNCLLLQFAKPNRSPTSAEQALKLIARTTALNRPTLPIVQTAGQALQGQALQGTFSSAAAPGE